MRTVFLYLFLCFLITISLASYGQTDTVYMDEAWKPCTHDVAKYYRIRTTDASNLYKIEDYFITSNKLQMTGYYSDKDSDDTKNGMFTYYTENGYKSSEGKYNNNKRVGEWKEYRHDLPIVWYTETYEEGDIIELNSYYKDGKLKRHEFYRTKDTTVSGKCFDEKGNEIQFTRFRVLPKHGYSVPEYLSNNLHYPYSARYAGIEGKVTVKYTVATDGSISNIKVIKKIGGGCDEEALRVVANMPKFASPGELDDEVTEMDITQPIMFKLE